MSLNVGFLSRLPAALPAGEQRGAQTTSRGGRLWVSSWAPTRSRGRPQVSVEVQGREEAMHESYKPHLGAFVGFCPRSGLLQPGDGILHVASAEVLRKKT